MPDIHNFLYEIVPHLIRSRTTCVSPGFLGNHYLGLHVWIPIVSPASRRSAQFMASEYFKSPCTILLLTSSKPTSHPYSVP